MLHLARFDSSRFSISTEYHLSVRGVVIATCPKVHDVICIRHKYNTTMEDIKVMVYLLLGLCIFVRLWEYGVGFCTVISLVARL